MLVDRVNVLSLAFVKLKSVLIQVSSQLRRIARVNRRAVSDGLFASIDSGTWTVFDPR